MIGTMLVLAGCAQTMSYTPGTKFEIEGDNSRYLVEIETPADAWKRCTALSREIGMLPLGTPACALYRAAGGHPGFDGVDIVTATVTLPAEAHCIVITGPQAWVLLHELQHCGAADGWKWHD